MEISRIVVKVRFKGGMKLDKVLYSDKVSMSLEELETALKKMNDILENASAWKEFYPGKKSG